MANQTLKSLIGHFHYEIPRRFARDDIMRGLEIPSLCSE
jgi:hypothetical protein